MIAGHCSDNKMFIQRYDSSGYYTLVLLKTWLLLKYSTLYLEYFTDFDETM